MQNPKEKDPRQESASRATSERGAKGDAKLHAFEVTAAIDHGGETHESRVIYFIDEGEGPQDAVVRSIKDHAMFFMERFANPENGEDPHGIIDFKDIEVTRIVAHYDGEVTEVVDPSEYDSRWTPSNVSS